MKTHIGDLGVGTVGVAGERIAELVKHTRLLLAAPHTLVLWVGVLTKTTVIPLNGTVVQCDCRESSKDYINFLVFQNYVIVHSKSIFCILNAKFLRII